MEIKGYKTDELIQIKRVQSPSSINLYKQCPRRYYYSYIKKLPTLPSIHLIRGNIVHSALENFFKDEQTTLEEFSKEEAEKHDASYKQEFRHKIQRLFLREWNSNLKALQNLNLPNLSFYLEDSILMLSNWVEQFNKKIEEELKNGVSLKDAFKKHSPVTEKELVNTNYAVKGFIDAIHNEDGKVRLVDYKTSKKDDLTEGYRLQLAIYALLYKEEYKVLPEKVAINFLKFGEKELDVDEELVEHAIREIMYVHENTGSEDINDYPKNITPLCKWKSGQCDFYDECFGAGDL